MKKRGQKIVDALFQYLLDKFTNGNISDEEFKVLKDLTNERIARRRVDSVPPKPYNAVIEPMED